MGDSGQGISAELELRGHFGGRRSDQRIAQQFSVLLRGLLGSFLARAVDVSRSGILLEMTDPSYAAGPDLSAFALAVERHFGRGADIHIVDAEEVAYAQLVRVTEDEGRLLVAFRFRKPLPSLACAKLGLPIDGLDIEMSSDT
jgi:hypothetical protein